MARRAWFFRLLSMPWSCSCCCSRHSLPHSWILMGRQGRAERGRPVEEVAVPEARVAMSCGQNASAISRSLRRWRHPRRQQSRRRLCRLRSRSHRRCLNRSRFPFQRPCLQRKLPVARPPLPQERGAGRATMALVGMAPGAAAVLDLESAPGEDQAMALVPVGEGETSLRRGSPISRCCLSRCPIGSGRTR